MTTTRPIASLPRRVLVVGVGTVLSLAATACGDRSPVTTPVDASRADAPSTVPVATESLEPVSTTPPSSPTTSTSTTSPSTKVVASTTTSTTTSETTIAPAAAPVSGWPAFDQRLMQILDDGSIAVSATVLRDGEVVHEVALGSRTSADDPVEIGDRYRIASISKVITAITTLRLVDAGLIDLDEPVGDRLAELVGQPVPAADVSAITPRKLLTHRSGIGQYESLVFDRQVDSCPAAGKVALGRGLDSVPGTFFRYSNVNFCLLGLLIEQAASKPYVDVVTEQLLDPLEIDGMRLAGTFDVGEGDVEHASREGRNYMEVLDGAGSWIASPSDVAAIVDSLDESTPGWKSLSPAMNAEMRTVTLDPPPDPALDEEPPPEGTPTTFVPPPPPTAGYGMGLMIFGPESFGHTGTVESTRAMTVRQPDGLTWAILVSGDAPSSSRQLATIMTEALQSGGFA